jgi:hypothetical protein
MRADARNFYLEAELVAFEGDQEVFAIAGERTIPAITSDESRRRLATPAAMPATGG